MILVVGAGFSGAVIARELADAGYKVKVIDSRDHVAGNCHTERDPQTNIMLHQYGPHIFHTNDYEVWKYINSFGEMVPYVHRVKAVTGGKVFSLPINLHTINQFFNANMTPNEAKIFIDKKRCNLTHAAPNFEEQALSLVGRELYVAFFKTYTEKQWGMQVENLSGSIMKRLPMRFNYDDNYYFHQYQGIPRYGYTSIVKKILDHENIKVDLCTSFTRDMGRKYSHVFYSGSIDSYFNYSLGRLPYRTLKFKRRIANGDYQGCAVMNYCDSTKPFTRITEFKHFSPWEVHPETVFIEEYSKSCEMNDIPYYPINLSGSSALLNEYKTLAMQTCNTTFIGRLGTYRYLDMDATIRESLNAVKEYLETV